MTINQEIHHALLSTIKYYNHSNGKRGDYHFYRFPHLTEKELIMISFIYDSELLRPRMYKLKKTDKFISLNNLIVPKDYDNYKILFNSKQLYNKYKNSLISKNVIVEISDGFILNHKLFPFKDRNTMTYLIKYISMPLPPE